MSPATSETSASLLSFRESAPQGADERALQARTPQPPDGGAWQNVVDQKLIEWGRQGGREDEDGVVWPSATTVGRARDLVGCLQDICRPPDRVIPNGDGGVAFEWYRGLDSVSIGIEEDGTVEVLRFENCRLVERVAL